MCLKVCRENREVPFFFLWMMIPSAEKLDKLLAHRTRGLSQLYQQCCGFLRLRCVRADAHE